MTLSAISSELSTLLGHFNVNISWSDEVVEYLDKFTSAEREALREEFETCLRLDALGMERFRPTFSKWPAA